MPVKKFYGDIFDTYNVGIVLARAFPFFPAITTDGLRKEFDKIGDD